MMSKFKERPKRRRTKKLYDDVKEQVEFYFSKSNLTHSTHFKELAGEDGTKYVPLGTLLEFNAVKSTGVDAKTLLKALKSSVILELNENEMSVHRRYAISNKVSSNLDACTLYMENLPHGTCMDWLKLLTKKIGRVEYISLPRYKKTGQLKGFAFVEFSRPEEVQRACRIFEDIPTNFFPKISEEHKIEAKNACKRFMAKRKKKSKQNKTTENTSTEQLNNCLPSTSNTNRKRPRRHSEFDSPSLLKSSDNHNDLHTPAKRSKSNPCEEKSKPTNKESHSGKVNQNCNMPKTAKTLFKSNLENSNTAENKCENIKTKNNVKIRHEKNNNIVLMPEVNGKKNKKSDNITNNIQFSPASEKSRKRSYSEPPLMNGVEESGKNQASKIARINKELEISLFANDIDSIISKGRREAEKMKFTSSKPTVQFLLNETKRDKRTIQSKIVNVSKKKVRKRSRKSTIWKELERAKQKVPKIKVMPKEEWINYKKQYKDLQRQNLGKLKQSMREIKTAGARSVFIKKHMDVLQSRSKEDESSVCSSSDSSASSSGDEADAEESEKIETENDTSKLNICSGPPTFAPGVIIKMITVDKAYQSENNPEKKLKPCFKSIKKRLEKYGKVAYVDVVSNNEVYVRYYNSISAQKAILEERELALNLLTGTEEEQYWEKLLLERAKKFARERKKIRGRSKLILKAEKAMQENSRKHIRFDHDF